MSRPPVGNDNDSTKQSAGAPPSLWGDVAMGLRFFSRLPTGNSPHNPPKMSAMVRALGLTSLIIGFIPGLILMGSNFLGLPLLLSASFGVAAQILVNGGMAEDGLADSADGIWGGQTPDNRLTIMKDSTHGTYGVLALILLILIRIIALATLAGRGIFGAVILWIGAQIFARQASLWLMLVLPSARKDGVASSTGSLSKQSFAIGGILALLIAGPFLAMVKGVFGLVIVAAIIVLIVAVWSRICKTKVGGYSGDLIGALQALVEIGALTTFIILS